MMLGRIGRIIELGLSSSKPSRRSRAPAWPGWEGLFEGPSRALGRVGGLCWTQLKAMAAESSFVRVQSDARRGRACKQREPPRLRSIRDRF
jgi:hypothetical protein